MCSSSQSSSGIGAAGVLLNWATWLAAFFVCLGSRALDQHQRRIGQAV